MYFITIVVLCSFLQHLFGEKKKMKLVHQLQVPKGEKAFWYSGIMCSCCHRHQEEAQSHVLTEYESWRFNHGTRPVSAHGHMGTNQARADWEYLKAPEQRVPELQEGWLQYRCCKSLGNKLARVFQNIKDKVWRKSTSFIEVTDVGKN